MDQVIYSTHSPAFIDVARYEQIACVRKDGNAGTKVKQCELGVLGDPEERKGFKLLTSFGLKHNEVFFARHAVLVEGVEDEIAVIAAGRMLQRFTDLPDEIGVSIVVTGNKEQIPKFQKVLNAFGLSYSVLLELDGEPEDAGVNHSILELAGANYVGKIPETLEKTVNLAKDHFKDIFEAKQFFSDPAHVSTDLEMIVTALFPHEGQPAAEAGGEAARVLAAAAQ
jgi:predicted ATP-dependent endonuclease of OLD family